jgi:hypothetical protein
LGEIFYCGWPWTFKKCVLMGDNRYANLNCC